MFKNYSKITKLFLIAIPTLHLFGVEIEITNPKTTFIQDSKKDYYITAKRYIEKIDANSAIEMLLFQKEFFLSNCYYANGTFTKGALSLNFNKAYKFSKKVHLFNVKGNYENATIQAKEAIYSNNMLLLKSCEINTPKKIIRRKKFKLILSNN